MFLFSGENKMAINIRNPVKLTKGLNFSATLPNGKFKVQKKLYIKLGEHYNNDIKEFGALNKVDF